MNESRKKGINERTNWRQHIGQVIILIAKVGIDKEVSSQIVIGKKEREEQGKKEIIF